MPDEPPGSGDELAALRTANARLRQVVQGKDTEIAALETGQAHQAELIRKLELRVAYRGRWDDVARICQQVTELR